jgi:hypothetical protein
VNFTKLIYPILFLLVSVSANAFAGVDYRFIDQPFSPHDHQRAFLFSSSTALEEVNSKTSDQSVWIDINLEYQQALDEQFALIWSPLPLGILIRDVDNDTPDEVGYAWNLGLSNAYEFGLKPRFDGSYRHKLSELRAVEIQLEYYSFFPFSKGHPNLWTASLTSGFILQISDMFALETVVEVSLNDNVLLRAYDKQSSSNDSFRYVVPIGLVSDFKLTAMAHLGLEYFYRGIGLGNSFRAHEITLNSVLRW